MAEVFRAISPNEAETWQNLRQYEPTSVILTRLIGPCKSVIRSWGPRTLLFDVLRSPKASGARGCEAERVFSRERNRDEEG